MRARLVLAACLAITAFCASCGSDSDGGGTTKTTSSVGPETVAASCAQLVGPQGQLVDDTLKVGEAIASGKAETGNDEASKVQDGLFTIVSTGPTKLQDPAGQLVDYLDDPAAYTADGAVDATVTDAVESIRTQCAAG